MKKKKNLQTCIFAGKWWQVIYFFMYVLYAFFMTYFTKLLGMSLDIAESKDMNQLILFFKTMVIGIFAISFLSLINAIIKSRYLEKIFIAIRGKLFNEIMNKSIAEFIDDGASQLSSALINDIKLIESNYIRPLAMLQDKSITLMISLIAMLRINWIVTIFVFIISFLPILIPKLFIGKLYEKMENYSNDMETLSSKTNEYLLGYEIFKNYNSEKYIIENFDKYNKATNKSKKNSFLYMDILSNTVAISSILITVGVLIVGMYLAIYDILSVGEVFALSFISTGISDPLSKISDLIPKISSSKAIVDKYNKLIMSKNMQKSYIETISAEISLRNVSLVVEDKKILDDISLTIEKGKKYIFVGESGSGKSTIIKLLMGFYATYNGTISIDNKSIQEIDLNSLYDNLSYVPQNNNTYQGTLKDNITFFDNDVDDDIVLKLLTMVELNNKITSLTDGIHTIINEGGSNFSGGEKQRIGIARAFYRDKELIILDEATSALDLTNYTKIETYISRLLDKTIISVTHRMNADILKQYDKIIALQNGKIVEEGTFVELMNKEGYFFHLFQSQII